MQPRDLELVANRRAAALDKARLCRRAAHVKGQQVGAIHQRAEVRRGECAGSRAGFHEPDRKAAGGHGGSRRTAGEHDEELASVPDLGQIGLQPLQIPIDNVQHVRVGNRGGRSLILAQISDYLVRERDSKSG